MPEMAEPYASEFRRLVRLGAGARDIHAAKAEVGFARRTTSSDAFVAREVSRIEAHRRGTCPILETFARRSPRVLDVGCSTGGSTVAMALSPVLASEVVVGFDLDALSLRAAEVRAKGHGLDPRRITFVSGCPEEGLPFGSDVFDLVVCVSVLEFLPTAEGRRKLVAEMKRVARPGGHVFLSTPSPLRLRDVHAKRLLGDVVRRDGFPWATPPWELRAMIADCERVPIDAWVVARALNRAGLPGRVVPPALTKAIAWAHAWQKVLVRKPEDRVPA
ncbi:MAG TPA: class I SAM-dependent methyltransferase [Polyangiaceae bacterium]|nr:class I SAM-dependent methyltransferase [Polyangiaceae bacterium]